MAESLEYTGTLLEGVLSEEGFRPAPPQSLEETGLSATLIESLISKYLAGAGTSSGRNLAEQICLPFGVLEGLFQSLRTRQILVPVGSAPLNDYYYTLTEQGRERAQSLLKSCAYGGPAPVPLSEYVLSVDAQTIRAEAPRREQLEKAFADISIDSTLFEDLGPAINSGAGLFLYGSPGNGKSTIARRITMCFGKHIWVPYAIAEDGQIIKVYDAARASRSRSATRTSWSSRWCRKKRTAWRTS